MHSDRQNRGYWALLTGYLLLVTMVPMPAHANQPMWKIGRVTVQPEQAHANVEALPHKQPSLMVKLSLRNEGRPGNATVEIWGRWDTGGQRLKGKLMPLRRLTGEVALKQTAIVMVSLETLMPPPPGKPPLELVVMTGPHKTDHQMVSLPAS